MEHHRTASATDRSRPRMQARGLVLASGLAVAALIWSARAQNAPQAPELQSLPPAEEPVPASRPGFLEALGRFIGQSKEVIDSQLRSSQDTLGTIGDKATDAAKEAAGAVIALPGTRIVTGRQLCPLAANGAPDCQQGAVALCRDKGFHGGGRSLDIMTSQRCPARSWLSGKGPKEGECRIENYVTRAVCQ